MDHILVQTTFADRKHAVQAARQLVDDSLAACAQVIGPITSTYRWKGEIRVEEEWLCVAKSGAHLYHELEERILAIHPYDTPEVVAIAVSSGNARYLTWLEESLASR